MQAQPWREAPPESCHDGFWRQRGRTVLTAASGLLGLAGFLTHIALAGGISAALGSEGLGVSFGVPLISRGLYLMAILAGSWYVLPKAWFSLRRLRPDMNL